MKPHQKHNLKIKILREGNKVRRCHVLPHIGEYTVGQHSADALGLLFTLYPGKPSLNLIQALLTHDITERFLGDMPSTAKGLCPELGEAYTKAEVILEKKLGTDFKLNLTEHKWLRAIDILELYLWSVEQLYMGNQNVRPWLQKLYSKLGGPDIPKAVQEVAFTYNATRLLEENYGQ